MSGELSEFLLKAEFLNHIKQLEIMYTDGMCKLSDGSNLSRIAKSCKLP